MTKKEFAFMRIKVVLPVVLVLMLSLSGCVSGRRLVRNSPIGSSGKFYRDGVNLWPLYYQEGTRKSIMFPLVDMDERGFAVRPFYHKDRDEHGILWPLIAFNPVNGDGWAGPLFWSRNSTGLLPLFYKGNDHLWVFPASWYTPKSCAVLPLFYKSKDTLWLLNVWKDKEDLLVFPFFGKGKEWFMALNYFHLNNEKEYFGMVLPLGYYNYGRKRKSSHLLLLPLMYCESVPDQSKFFLSPLFSFDYTDKLNMLNIGMLLYHYSQGDHRVMYPFADVNFKDGARECWLWPLFSYGRYGSNGAPFFLFKYQDSIDEKNNERWQYEFSILEPLLFEYQYSKSVDEAVTRILPWGLLWYSNNIKDYFDHRVLGGLLYHNSKNPENRRFSLLYKFFSYHRFRNDVKVEFFPFVKIMKTARGDSWSFCWRLLEKHDGGGHIFFIPWGKPAPGSR